MVSTVPCAALRATLTPNRTEDCADHKTTVHYNDRITIRDIPLEAYEYVVNGKPALEWLMERQSVTTDSALVVHRTKLGTLEA